MNGIRIRITITARVDDGQGDTCRESVDVYVLGTGEVVYSNGSPVRESELVREENQREVTRGRMEARLAVVNEKLLAIDSGTSIGTFCSSITKAYSRRRLIEKKEEIEQQLAGVGS